MAKKIKKRDFKKEIQKAEDEVADSIEAILSELDPLLDAAKWVLETVKRHQTAKDDLAALEREAHFAKTGKAPEEEVQAQ